MAFEHFDQGYRALGTNGTDSRPKDQLVASGGVSLGFGITQGVSYTRQTTWEGGGFTLVGTNFGVSLPGGMYLSAYANKQMNSANGYSGGIGVLLPLGRGRSLDAGSTRDPAGREVNTLRATQSIPSGPGWGWQVAGERR